MEGERKKGRKNISSFAYDSSGVLRECEVWMNLIVEGSREWELEFEIRYHDPIGICTVI